MNELQLLRKQEECASRRIHELEQIIGDVSSSIVKRSKAKVELAGLQSHDVAKSSVDIGDTGQVAKNRERVEREILRNLERAGREEEIRRLQELLRDEHAVKSTQRRKELERRLREAEAAIKALDIEEAAEEKARAAVGVKKRGVLSATQGKIDVDVFQRDTEVSQEPKAKDVIEEASDRRVDETSDKASQDENSFAHFLDILFDPEAQIDTPVASNHGEAKPKDEAVEEEEGRTVDTKGIVATIEPGIVAKGTAKVEQSIKRNKERAKYEAEIVRLRQELRDETESVLRIQKLVDQLKAAEAALKALDVEEAAEAGKDSESDAPPSEPPLPRDTSDVDNAELTDDTNEVGATIEPGVVAKGSAKVKQGIKRNAQRAKYETEIERLRRELRDETESVGRIQKLVEQLKAAEEALVALTIEAAEAVEDPEMVSGRPRFAEADEDDVAVDQAKLLVEQYGELDVEEAALDDDLFIKEGAVAKGTATFEQGIKRNEERARREAEIELLRQELRSVAVFGSAERMSALMEQLKAAEVALDAMEIDEASEARETDTTSMPPIAEIDETGDVESLEQAAKPPFETPGSPRCVSVAEVKPLFLATGPQERSLSFDEMQAIIENQNNENAERIRKLEAEIEKLISEGREKDKLVEHWKEKAETLARECLSLEVDVEERNAKIRELQDWRKIQDERIVTLQSQQLTAQHPPLYTRQGSRRFSTHALSDPSFRATLRRASTHGKTLEEQIQEEATAEIIALEERLAMMDGEREQLLCELKTMKSIVKQSYDNCSKGKKKKGKRLIYQLSCRQCNQHMDFIGTTHKDLKTTVGRHIDAVVKELDLEGHADNGDKLESWSPDFATHFAKHLRDMLHKRNLSRKVVTTFCRANVKCEVLRRQDGAELMWQDDSIHTEMAGDEEFLQLLSQ